MDETSLISTTIYAQRLTRSKKPAPGLEDEDFEQPTPERYRESIFTRLRAILLHQLNT